MRAASRREASVRQRRRCDPVTAPGKAATTLSPIVFSASSISPRSALASPARRNLIHPRRARPPSRGECRAFQGDRRRNRGRRADPRADRLRRRGDRGAQRRVRSDALPRRAPRASDADHQTQAAGQEDRRAGADEGTRHHDCSRSNGRARREPRADPCAGENEESPRKLPARLPSAARKRAANADSARRNSRARGRASKTA